MAAPTPRHPEPSYTSISAAASTTRYHEPSYTPISMIDTNITPVAIPLLQPGRLPLCLTIEEIGAELQSGRAAGPGGVCPRLLRDCAGQRAAQSLFIGSSIYTGAQIRATGGAE